MLDIMYDWAYKIPADHWYVFRDILTMRLTLLIFCLIGSGWSLTDYESLISAAKDGALDQKLNNDMGIS